MGLPGQRLRLRPAGGVDHLTIWLHGVGDDSVDPKVLESGSLLPQGVITSIEATEPRRAVFDLGVGSTPTELKQHFPEGEVISRAPSPYPDQFVVRGPAGTPEFEVPDGVVQAFSAGPSPLEGCA